MRTLDTQYQTNICEGDPKVGATPVILPAKEYGKDEDIADIDGKPYINCSRKDLLLIPFAMYHPLRKGKLTFF